MKLKALFILTALAIGVISTPALVWAAQEVGGNTEEIQQLNAEIEARKQKIKDLEATMAKTKQLIEQKQTQSVSLKNTLSILDNHVSQTELDIMATQETIKQSELEIEALTLSIDDKEKSMGKQKKLITAVIKNIHAADQKNYLEIMLTNENFSDFYNQSKYLETVYTDLGRSVKNLRLAKDDLDNKKQQIADKKQKYDELKVTLENKRLDLNDQIGEKNVLLIRTKADEATFRTLLANQKKQYQAIEDEVSSYESQVRKKLEQANKISETGNTELGWPLANHYITASFHDPEYPYRKVFEHSAIDLRASQGTPVYAAAAGYIARAKRCALASCYAYVLMVHSGEVSTVYGHLSNIAVSEDQFVARGDIVGYSGGKPGTVGAGPFTTAAHLHFEVRKNGIPVDPLGYLN